LTILFCDTLSLADVTVATSPSDSELTIERSSLPQANVGTTCASSAQFTGRKRDVLLEELRSRLRDRQRVK
jgi:hypothetical protein